VTLPIEWLRLQRLKARDEVDVSSEGDALIVRAAKKSVLLEKTLHLDSGTADYYRIMVENHYLKAFDRLHLTLSDRKAITSLKKIVSNLIGYEIISETRNGCVIASTAEASSEQFSTLLRRCLHIISHSIALIKEDVSAKKSTHSAEIEELSDDARRFLLYCTRTLHKISVVSRDDESFMHLLLERLILIEHNLWYLSIKLPANRKLKFRSNVLALFDDSCEMFSLFEQMFLHKNLDGFSKVNKLWHDIYFERGQKLFVGCNLEESIILYHSMYFAKQMFLISQPSLIMQKIEN